MAHRNFVDSAGVAWQVWDVVPAELQVDRFALERRHLADRRLTPGEPPGGVERRRRPDRRESTADVRRGWLAFQCDTERRRFAPVPSGWERLDDGALERLCRAARPARPSRAERRPDPGR